MFTWVVGYPLDPFTPLPANESIPGNLGLACGSSPLGPFTQVSPSFFPYRLNHFDGAFLENPVLTRLSNGSWVLAYTSTPPSAVRNYNNWAGSGEEQYIGLAFADDPLGPWQRSNATVLPPDPGGFEKGIANNPALLELPDGSLSLTYRGGHDEGFGNCLAKDWRGPCIRPPTNAFNQDTRWMGTEDPFTYRSPRGGGYIMLAHRFWGGGNGTKAVSRDGINWVWASQNAYNYTLALTNGSVLEFARREEPKLLFDGYSLRPTHLFTVVCVDIACPRSHIVVQELEYSA
jgi:hypothetical protein